jgi:hypothetical protein
LNARISIAILFAAFIGCRSQASNAAEETDTAAKESKPMKWTVTIDTSGGITGRGLGRVEAHSDGSVSATSIPSKSAETKLTAEELQTLDRLVRAADPKHWQVSPEQRGADYIIYTIRLEREGEMSHTLTWSDGTPPPIPHDVEELREALWDVRDRAVNGR